MLGLDNQVHLKNGIKSTSKIPDQIVGKYHTGNRPCEIALARPTLVEQELYDAGLKGLALSLREARLISYDREYRQLQLLQNQANFPFLFLASIMLHRELTVQKLNRVLMCSRDAFLWHQLQEKVLNLHCNAAYDIHYLWTSRLTRYFPTAQVLNYTQQMLTDKTLIVDVCGSGRSLWRFTDHLSPKPSLWLIVGYGDSKRGFVPRIPYAIEWLGTTAVELANLAKHPMVCDITQNPDKTFAPIFVNPANVNWAHVPQINAMHEAFNLVISVMPNYDFSTDLRIDRSILVKMMKKCFQRIEDGENLLRAFAYPSFGVEEGNTRRTLRARKHDLEAHRPLDL